MSFEQLRKFQEEAESALKSATEGVRANPSPSSCDACRAARSKRLPPGPEVRATVEILNKRGLHIRCAWKLESTAARFNAVVRMEGKDGHVHGCKGVLALVMLGAGEGSKIDVIANGPEAHAALEAITTLVADRFGVVDDEDDVPGVSKFSQPKETKEE